MTENITENLPETITINLSRQLNAEASRQSMDELLIPDQGVSFYLPRIAQALIVHTDDNFFIGRSVNETSSTAMLNLEDFDGFAMGVSRRHALVRAAKQGYEIIDLFSRNGTWLGDQRLIPNKAYPLTAADLLRVGQERMLVRYHSA